MLKSRRLTATLSIITAITIVIFAARQINNVFASPFCVSQECKAAEAAEKEAERKAAASTNAAKTLEGEVERLDAEITAMEAKITTLQAEAKDLARQIAENKVKLQDQQQTLAGLLIDMHFTGSPDTITILASSSSIGDYAEKQSRLNTAKEQISISAQNIKNIKKELENQKAEVDRNIANQKLQKETITTKRNEQSNLIARYRYNASAFAADAAKARKQREAFEAIAYKQYLNSIGGSSGVITDPGLNTYPFAGQCPGLNWRFTGNDYAGAYGGSYCECTSYAGWKTFERWRIQIGGPSWGDAAYWGTRAKQLGYRVDNTPEVHSVGYYTWGAWGHVVWIEKVNGNGTIDYSEYNGLGESNPAIFSYRTGVSASKFRYIHFR